MNIASTLKETTNINERTSVVDTTFVLFFMALELGRSFLNLRADTFMLAATLLVVMSLPYFLIQGRRQSFMAWTARRSLIAGFAFVCGIFFSWSLGAVLPETFKFMPMTLLIVSAMLCCIIQFYSFLNLRRVR